MINWIDESVFKFSKSKEDYSDLTDLEDRVDTFLRQLRIKFS